MGRQYKKDTIQFLHVARGSVYELDTQLEIANMTGFLPTEKSIKLTHMIDNVLKLLNGLINYTEKATLK